MASWVLWDMGMWERWDKYNLKNIKYKSRSSIWDKNHII